MRKKTETVSFTGLGYVGLCTAVSFAVRGFRTVAVDIDNKRVEQIQKGHPPFREPQLEKMLKTVLRHRFLEATSDVSATAKTDTTFITVGTPSRPDGSIDLTYVTNAARDLGSALRNGDKYHLVVIKSTVIPGTTTSTVKPVLERESGKTIGQNLGICTNPEFLKEGTAIQDTFNPDKIVIGASDHKSANRLKLLYQKFHRGELPPTILTTPETAEMIKYASNSFLATKVSYINTIANICQQTPGVDVERVAEAIGLDPRIGPLFLKAGPGYGGSCFHKDLQALMSFSQSNGYDPVLFRATEEVNQEQASRIVALSEKLLGRLNDRRIAILGLAFKKDTDDIREAASIRIIDRLRKKGARIVAYDPAAMPNARKLLADGIEFAEDSRSALKEADCCIVLTEWDEFRRLTPEDYLAQMKTPNVVDARRVYDPEKFTKTNFTGVGLEPLP